MHTATCRCAFCKHHNDPQLPPPTRPQQRQHGKKKAKQQLQKRKEKKEIILRHPLNVIQKNARCLEQWRWIPTVANGTPFFCAKHGDKNTKRSGSQNVAIKIGCRWIRSKTLSLYTLEHEIIQTKYVSERMISATVKCDHHKIDLATLGIRGHAHREDVQKHRVTLQESSRATSTLSLGMGTTLKKTTLANTKRVDPVFEGSG